MTGAHHERLFSRIELGPVTLRNRIVQSSLSSLYTDRGAVTERLIDFYRARAASGAAAIVTGALVTWSGNRVPTRTYAFDDSHLDGLKRLAAAVEGEDCRLLGQIVDPGRGRNAPGRSPRAIGASPLPDDLSWTVPHALSSGEVRRIIDEFAHSADRLRRAGFSGVELSCAHGHLLHQFLSPQANRRDDDYGGDLEGRTRFVRELCGTIRDLCGGRFLIGLKVPGDDGVPGGIGPELAEATVARLARDGLGAYFAVAQGAHHRSLEMHVPDRTYPRLPYRHLARRIKAAAGAVPVACLGRITTPDEAEEVLAEGDCDLVMIGRAMLADAGWVAKAGQGREEDIALCVACNTCWGTISFGQPVCCDVNPRLGTPNELGWRPKRAEKSRRVTVVGAGVAGLEAARVAAARGHHVTLLGAGRQPGGKVALHAALPGAELLARAWSPRWRDAEGTVASHRLGSPAGLEDVMATSPDVVIMASGARMRRPDVLADATPGVLDLREAASVILAAPPEQRAGTAVLYDCDHTDGTYDGALLLARHHRRTVLVTPRDGFAGDVPTVVRQRILRSLHEAGVELVAFHELAGFDDGRALFANVYTGSDLGVGDVDLLVYSTARVPNDELVAPLLGEGIEVGVVGDAFAPRFLLHAVAEGHRAGNDV